MAVDAEHSHQTAKAFLQLLGWSVAGDDKDLPMAEVFQLLGVELDLGRAIQQEFFLRNAERRVRELAETAEAFLERSAIAPAAAAFFVGRLRFAGGHLFG
eukprot:1824570-Lingulodinium_polyedra.AAC.1